MIWIGCLAFLLFFVSDLNDHKLRIKALVLCFPVGAVLLCAVTVISCLEGTSRLPDPVKAVTLLLGLLFFAFLVKSLFFSMPANEAYIERGEGRSVSSDGLYALCRHPGVLFFIPTYICISLTFGMPFYETAVYSALNILLIVYEDVFVFPKVLRGYAEYKKDTPFLIPNAKGIKKAINYCKVYFSRGGKKH